MSVSVPTPGTATEEEKMDEERENMDQELSPTRPRRPIRATKHNTKYYGPQWAAASSPLQAVGVCTKEIGEASRRGKEEGSRKLELGRLCLDGYCEMNSSVPRSCLTY